MKRPDGGVTGGKPGLAAGGECCESMKNLCKDASPVPSSTVF
jgi:hypothetical protein